MAPLETAKRYFELSNSGSLDAIENIIHSESIYNSDATGLYFGREDIMKMMRAFYQRFEYLHWEIKSIVEPRAGVIEIWFHVILRNQKEEIRKDGKEIIIVQNDLIRYIEVTNKSIEK